MEATAFLTTAEVAERLIGSGEVAERWSDDSVLDGYTVGGLAGHLARAVLTVERYLAEADGAEGEPTDAAGYLVRVLQDSRTALTAQLDDLDPSRPPKVIGGTVLSAEDYLETRLLELVVHLDDLAVSLGQDRAEGVPPDAYARVAALLARVAAERAGGLETVRSLSRRERHPEPVRAL